MRIGTVTTGSAGSNASASITKNGDNDYSLNLTIPRGNTGSQGPTGPTGPQGPSGISRSSITNNGYVVFSNGLILQWIYKATETTASSATSVNFPISFNTLYGVFTTSAGISGAKTISNIGCPYTYNISSITLSYQYANSIQSGTWVLGIGK